MRILASLSEAAKRFLYFASCVILAAKKKATLLSQLIFVEADKETKVTGLSW